MIYKTDLCHLYYGLFDGRPGVFVQDLTTTDGVECYKEKQNFAIRRLNYALQNCDGQATNELTNITLPFIMRYLFETDLIDSKTVREIVVPRMANGAIPLEIRSKYVSVLMDTFGRDGDYIAAMSVHRMFIDILNDERKQRRTEMFYNGKLLPTEPLYIQHKMVGVDLPFGKCSQIYAISPWELKPILFKKLPRDC